MHPILATMLTASTVEGAWDALRREYGGDRVWIPALRRSAESERARATARRLILDGEDVETIAARCKRSTRWVRERKAEMNTAGVLPK